MKKFYHTCLSENEKKYYSLNFLFAELHKNENDISLPPLNAFTEKIQNKNIIVGRFYKNISTIYNLNNNE